jgi:hypothetical protein
VGVEQPVVAVAQEQQAKAIMVVQETAQTALQDRAPAAVVREPPDKILLIIIKVVPVVSVKFGHQAELPITRAVVEDPHTQDQAALGD